MEPGDLHVRINRHGRGSHCTLLIRIFALDGTRFDFEIPIDIAPTTLTRPVVPAGLPSLIAQYILAHIEKALGMGKVPKSFLPLRILLEIEPLDLVGLDWENLLRLALPAPRAIITRFRPVSDMRAVRSFDLPLSVLHALRLPGLDISPTDKTMRYFSISSYLRNF